MTDTSVSEESDLATIVGLLDDEHARSILTAASVEPMSASELSDLCDVSESTIYRRVDRLSEESLLQETTRPRPDGHHETVYSTNLDTFEVTVRDGEITWEVTRKERDMADELSRLWDKF